MLNKTIVTAAALAVAACANAQTVNPWPALARADLDFVYQTLRDDHPGAIDQENGAFRAWMDKGYAQACEWYAQQPPG